MAGIAVPDSLRPTVAAVAKHHFWILAALVPLVLVPTLLVGTGGLRGRIATQRRQIDAKLAQARTVTAVQPHPNDGWRTAIETETAAVDRETLDEWRRFWHSQRGFRTWPASLGREFLVDVAALKPGGKLNRQSLVRYQNEARDLVRTLPPRMGVASAMDDKNVDGAGMDGQLRPGRGGAKQPTLTWNPASQRALYDSFVWKDPPSTTQVLLAQEELWVYGLFCDLLAGFVKGASGFHDSPLIVVEQLAAGFPAREADDGPGLRQRRIVLPDGAAGDPAALSGLAPPAGRDGPAQAPWHPRFSSGGGPPQPAPGAGAQPGTTPDDALRGWIYVDFAGASLSAAELAAKPELRMVHLMPFVLRVVVDQRHLDRLLVTLAESPVPIDVREVRINPGAAGAGASDLARDASGGARPDAEDAERRFDVVVELRGSVALATPPSAGTQSETGTTP